MNHKKPLLIVLDDWEGLIAQNPCWDRLRELVDIQFLKEPIDKTPDSVLTQVFGWGIW